MSHKWFRRAVIVLGILALLGAVVALAQSQTQNLVLSIGVGLFTAVVLLETHLHQVARDQKTRLAHRQA